MYGTDLRYLLSSSSGASGSYARSRSQIIPSTAPLPPIPSTLNRAPTLAIAESRKPRPLGLRNLGNTCYQNSVYQALLSIESFADVFRGVPSVSSPLAARLEELVREREETTLSGVVQDPRRVRETLKSRMWRGREQQDALEFYLALVDQLNDEVKIGNFDRNFRGSLLTRTRCNKCGTESTKKDPFFVVPLPIDSASSLEEALRSFQSEEALDGVNSYECERCKRKTEAVKSVEFQELPDVLVFAFKRFRWTNQGRCEKNGKQIKFPVNNLIVPCTGSSLGKKYDLVATVHHKGYSTDSGHYTAHVKREKWYLCDDAHVAELAVSDVSSNVVTSDTYMLFYQSSNSGSLGVQRPGLSPATKSMLLAAHTTHRQFSFCCVEITCMYVKITSTALAQEDGGVEYVLSVSGGSAANSRSHTIKRRYSDFDRLVFDLEWAGLALLPTLPGKTLFKHTSGPVVAERIQGLTRFVNELIARPDVKCSEIFRNFLEISGNPRPSDEGLQLESQMDGSRLPLRDFAMSKRHARKSFIVHGDNSAFARMGKLWQVVEKDELGAFAVVEAPDFPAERSWRVVGSRIYPQQANCVASDGDFAVVGTDTGRVLLYDFSAGNFAHEHLLAPKAELELHGCMPVLSVAMEFPIVASVGFDCALRVYDVAQDALVSGGRLKKRLASDAGEVLTRVKLFDRKFAVISSNKNHVFLYDITKSPNPELVHTYALPNSTEIADFVVIGNFREFPELLVAHDCVLSRVTVDGRTTVCAFPGARISRVERLGDFIALGTSDGAVGVVSLVSGKTLAGVKSAFDAEITKIEFLDERRLAVAAEDGRLRVWRLDGSLATEFGPPPVWASEAAQEGEAVEKPRTVSTAALLAEDEEDEWKKEIFL